jgi:uncharacterized protein YdeI (YjbR/CyaY-like superfamily)
MRTQKSTQVSDLPSNAVHPKSRAAWRQWLTKHHESNSGVFVVTYKKAAGIRDMSYDDMVEEALCFGWIDSKPQKLDEDRTMLYFSPRKAKSGWSRPNKIRVEAMIKAGLMTAAGLAKIDAAKENGTWEALDAVEDLALPVDLVNELKRYANASANFDAFPRSAKRGILEWISLAKRSETRAKRIEETARLAQDNVRANQWSPKS